MQKVLLSIFLVCCWAAVLPAQNIPLSYYLPSIDYDPAVPTPEQVLGFPIGKWHLTHDQLLLYVRAVAAKSDRIRLEETGRTHEDRPLVILYITSPANQGRLEEIRQQHLALSDPEESKKADVSEMPAVVYQGFTIHGDEASGANAAPLVLYYLAAGRSEEVLKLLDHTVILFDPCFNPDGMQRFATWVNMNKSRNLVADPQNRELNQPWPGGRTNHYWFDLNRDWLPAQQPESQARLRVFQAWKPNILTDHHEMGWNSTFFFQPGVPERTNPLTPERNQELTAQIGQYHAAALDAIGSLYFSQENYDDFYYGKGSTYPDLNGGIGILFEQAGLEGHLRETANGTLHFSFPIRNQVTTALSTLKAAGELRTELLDYQRAFYQSGVEEARTDKRKAFVFSAPGDPARARAFIELLLRHQIRVQEVETSLRAEEKTFEAGQSFAVPLEQPQYRLIRTLFENVLEFRDSIFYDISAWTLPLAFQLEYASLDKGQWKDIRDGKVLSTAPPLPLQRVDYSAYAYLMHWSDYYAPKALNLLQQKGIRTKVATEPFGDAQGRTFERGTILVAVQNQDLTPAALHEYIMRVSQESGISFYAVKSGLNPAGIDLGSNNFRPLEAPRPAMITGEGVSSTDAGEVWHLLDQRYGMPLTMLDMDDMGRYDLSKYQTLILADGRYNNLSAGATQNIRQWVQSGGTLILLENAVKWGAEQQLAKVKMLPEPKPDSAGMRRPYADLQDDLGAKSIRGTIFPGQLDRTHPLGYGFSSDDLPLFRNNTVFFKAAENPYATPLLYTSGVPISGFRSDVHQQNLSQSAGIVVSGFGRGRVICMAQDPNFRAFWYGTNKLMANALFFGGVIEGRGME
ncbi:MAG: zinc carboxypeptidase [Saprospirales bacterium]|nr:zinc carboxypeptidase [Saprospirales bacterium]